MGGEPIPAAQMAQRVWHTYIDSKGVVGFVWGGRAVPAMASVACSASRAPVLPP